MKTILALLMLATPTLADHCRNQNVVIQSTGAVITQFAVPVAVPVAVASPYLYQHSGAQAASQPNPSINPAELAEFQEWKQRKIAEYEAAMKAWSNSPQQDRVSVEIHDDKGRLIESRPAKAGPRPIHPFDEAGVWARAMEQAKASTFKAQALPQTLLQQNCVKCHSDNADAKGHFDMSKELTADQKLSAIRAVMTGKMPKAKTLDPQVRADLIAEISGVEEAK